MTLLSDLNPDELEALIMFKSYQMENNKLNTEEKEKLSERLDYLFDVYDDIKGKTF